MRCERPFSRAVRRLQSVRGPVCDQIIARPRVHAGGPTVAGRPALSLSRSPMRSG